MLGLFNFVGVHFIDMCKTLKCTNSIQKHTLIHKSPSIWRIKNSNGAKVISPLKGHVRAYKIELEPLELYWKVKYSNEHKSSSMEFQVLE